MINMFQDLPGGQQSPAVRDQRPQLEEVQLVRHTNERRHDVVTAAATDDDVTDDERDSAAGHVDVSKSVAVVGNVVAVDAEAGAVKNIGRFSREKSSRKVNNLIVVLHAVSLFFCISGKQQLTTWADVQLEAVKLKVNIASIRKGLAEMQDCYIRNGLA